MTQNLWAFLQNKIFFTPHKKYPNENLFPIDFKWFLVVGKSGKTINEHLSENPQLFRDSLNNGTAEKRAPNPNQIKHWKIELSI